MGWKQYKIHAYKLWIGSAFSIILVACKKEGSISLSNTNDAISAEIADSITVNASTYQLSPLPSNGQGIMLVGNVNDAATGNLLVSSYFRIGNSAISSVTIPEDALLDSISLALPYQGYYYGDTTLTQRISLHRVTEDLELVDESVAWEDDEKPVFASGSALFTNNTFTYDTNVLGEASFSLRPHTKTETTADTVFIKLDRSFSEDLWSKIVSADLNVTNADNFISYLKGFVLVPQHQNSIITAFPTDSLLMNVYYSHTRDSDGKQVQEKIAMKVDDNTYQFNSIKIDRNSSLLKGLASNTAGELSAAATKQQVMLQGLTGLVTKIQFPYLYELVNRNNVIINKAELTIEVTQPSYTLYAAPSTLNMLLADKHGVPTALLTSSYESSTQTAYFLNDLSGGTANSSYTFNLTEYVSNFRGADEDTKSALYLSIPVTDLLTKTDRLLIGKEDQSPLIKLRITYTKY